MRRYACLNSNKVIKLLREVSNEEYDNITLLSKRFTCFMYEAKYYKVFEKAYKELTEGFENFSDNKNAIENSDLNRYTMNYLFAVRTFLDHWETRIKREYRGNQQYIDLFKNATSFEYNNNMAYRIVYRLRNYVQHCEMPISNVKKKLNEKDEKELFVYLNRDRLLSNFDEWKPEEITYLKSLDEEFELLPFFSEMNNCLLRIHNKLINFNIDESFMLDCIKVLKVRRQFKEYKGSLSIVEYSDESLKKDGKVFTEDNTKINIEQIPVQLCEQILKLHIQNNETFIKVFNFNGKCVGEADMGFPYIIDKDENGNDLFIMGKEIIRVNNRNWVRLFEYLSIGNINDYISVYADSGFGVKEMAKLSKLYGDLCQVLYK